MTYGNSHREARSEAPDALDDYPTPPWAVRAVLEYVARHLSDRRLGGLIAREPCCNRGHMLRACQEYFAKVEAFDCHDYGIGAPVRDFLMPERLDPVDWTIMNPPFRLAQEFVERAIETSNEGVIAIARTSFIDGEARCRDLFRPHKPTIMLQFAERVPMLRGRMVRKGEIDRMAAKPGTKASTATAYCAMIWVRRYEGPTMLDWIDTCRLEMEKPGDYPDDPDGPAILHNSIGGA